MTHIFLVQYYWYSRKWVPEFPSLKTEHFPNFLKRILKTKRIFFAQASISPSVDHYKACSTPSPSGKTCDPSIQDPKLCRTPSLLTRASSSTRLARSSPANYTSIISLCVPLTSNRPPDELFPVYWFSQSFYWTTPSSPKFFLTPWYRLYDYICATNLSSMPFSA